MTVYLERFLKNSLILLFILSFSMVFGLSWEKISVDDNHYRVNKFLFPPDSINPDTTQHINMPYTPEDEQFPYTGDENTDPLFLNMPENIESDVSYDPETGEYMLEHKIGDEIDFRSPTYMTLDDYRDYDLKNSVNDYWRERSKASGAGSRSGIIPSIYIGGKAFDRIFGGHTIDIRPSGSVELIFGVIGNSRDDPTLDVRQRKQVNFDFQENIQMNVIAKIGDKIEFRTNYNTEATFDFENKLNLRYEGDEDEILQLVEAGDVNLPLNSTLITGSQSLFGIKTKMRFGKTTVTTIFSEQESETSNITVQGGAQTHDFLFKADEYESDKHFFISHFFRDNYQNALEDLPIVNSSINVTKIEVWVTNIGSAVTENRNFVAFTDLAENNPDVIYNDQIQPSTYQGAVFPDTRSNNLLSIIDSSRIRDLNGINNYLLSKGFLPGEDFDKVELARKLGPSEYSYNSKLGFISLNSSLSENQSLAIAYQYQVIGFDSLVFQVGEFSDEGITGQDALILKLLRSTHVNTLNPIWDLMMKNVYSLSAYQVNREDFTLNILYSGDESGVPTGYFEEGPFNGQPLIQVFNLDNLNAQLNPVPDAVFDFIDNATTQGGTINSSNGRIFFTVLEPFGSYLSDTLKELGYADLAEKYGYDSLYTLTKTGAQQYAEKNKFLISGYYKSQSGSEISLNALNVPQGSVTVTAGGVPLTENVDYTVDYTLGRVKIINEGILNSGTPINVKLESNSMFSIQTKRLMGAHIDYDVSRDFHLGGTILNLHERPLTQKVNYGNDPISNTIWGMDYSYQTESRFVTKLVDALPFISTSAKSNIAIDGEFAQFIPGHSKAVGKTGTSYLDDFEGTKSTIDMRNFGTWFLASTPQFQDNLFPEAQDTGLAYGYNRAKMSWYTIDPSVFYDQNSNIRPENVTNDELSNNYVRQILETEVFPNRDIPNGTPTNIGILNVAYYPDIRGPYNYDVTPTTVSSGINADGVLNDPQSRWGGMMRKIESSDFEAANIEYIEFWVMDPFAADSENDGTGGDLYFNLGDVSEDVLKDSRKAYEHGLPITVNPTIDDFDTTQWGRVPNKLDLVQSFSNESGARDLQDVGYDGLRDEDEQNFYSSASISPYSTDYLDQVEAAFGAASNAYQSAFADPSADNFHNYRGEDYDANALYGSVLERYKQYTGPDGNSPENNEGGVYDGNTRQPNMEDLNGDNTLNEAERYFQYRIQLKPNKMNVGENFITDIHEAVGVPLANGETGSVKWYQFKVPVREPDKIVGSITDFKSIRFMRMFMKNFNKPVVLRFATLDLVRGEWRRYPSSEDLLAPGEYIPNSTTNSKVFELSAVNVEENANRIPINYVIPPGIEQEINIGTTNLTRLNEQSMVMNVCELVDGDVAAAYKTAEFDFRQFKRLRMFVHAENSNENDVLKYGDLTIFLRIGSDFTQNYYEYEIPLSFTDWYEKDPQLIWPVSNEFDIDLEKLASFKLQRNTAMQQPGSQVSLSFPFVGYDGNNKVTVLGSPSISDVETMLIGIRNPKKTQANPDDDGEAKCAEIWVNELRLTDFNQKSGWATTGRVSMNLADFGNLAVSGTYSSPWFASIDTKITDIQLDAVSQFDIATNLELGKFFKEKSGIKIPMHFDYSEARIKPEYNPLDPDLKMDDVIDSYELKDSKDSIKNLTIDYTQRKNLNFINVRKDKVGAQSKSRIYDVENFNVSYSYSEEYRRNVDIERNLRQNYIGGLGYNFNSSPKNYKPFEKIGFISNSKALLFLKDFNFYLLPKMFSFRTDMNRFYSLKKMRNKSFGDVKTPQTYDKSWDWNRMYDLNFDLAKSLSLSFTANSNSFINEFPESNQEVFDKQINGEDVFITPDEKQQRVKDEIMKGGTKSRYTQNLGINYNIPINKFPLLGWLTAQAGYQVAYNWNASPVSIQQELGNSIANNQNITLNGNADLNKIYNSIGFLKNINQPKRANKNRGKQGKQDPKEENNPNPADSLNKKPKVNYGKIAYESFFKLLMSVKKLSFQYSQNNGTSLPGFMPEPGFIGNNWGNDAPGLPFIFGYQPSNPTYFNNQGWLSSSLRLNTAYGKNYSENMNFRATLEPFKGFKIDITADRNFSTNHQSYYVFDTVLNDFRENSTTLSGSYSISFISWGTAFGGSIENEKSKYFEELKSSRYDIAQRVASDDPRDIPINDSTGYPQGYGENSQYVLMPAFLSAYSSKSASNVSLDPILKIPLPNWRVSYAGLSKIPFFKQFFKSFTINHSYRSTYAIGSFNSDINFIGENIDGKLYPTTFNPNNGDYYTENNYAVVSITEQFAPLINFDMTMQNSLLAKIEIKKSRNLTMSFANNQLTEITSDEFILGLGYRFKDVPLSFGSLGGKSGRTFKSDLNLKGDLSIRTNKTVLRSIDTDLDQISAGQKVVSIKTSIDYMMSQSLTLRLFFDKIINNPFLPSQYRNSTTNGGISLRFSLAQ